MKVIILDGTPDEIRQAFPDLPLTSSVNLGSAAAPAAQSEVADEWSGHPPVSTEVAHAMLTRRPLSNEQKKALKAIYDAGKDGITSTDLMKLIGYDRPKFSGFMGAFGRRLTATPGYVDWTWFFDQEWNSEEGVNTYALPGTVRKAMEQAKLA